MRAPSRPILGAVSEKRLIRRPYELCTVPPVSTDQSEALEDWRPRCRGPAIADLQHSQVSLMKVCKMSDLMLETTEVREGAGLRLPRER